MNKIGKMETKTFPFELEERSLTTQERLRDTLPYSRKRIKSARSLRRELSPRHLMKRRVFLCCGTTTLGTLSA